MTLVHKRALFSEKTFCPRLGSDLKDSIYNALISAHPGGWLRGTPGHLHNDVYKIPLPKTKIV